MKNLKINSSQFNAKDMLTREQMKGIKGGTGVTVQCYCNGQTSGYCICQTTPECIECCEVACGG